MASSLSLFSFQYCIDIQYCCFIVVLSWQERRSDTNAVVVVFNVGIRDHHNASRATGYDKVRAAANSAPQCNAAWGASTRAGTQYCISRSQRTLTTTSRAVESSCEELQQYTLS
jgi:hypothetical protein